MNTVRERVQSADNAAPVLAATPVKQRNAALNEARSLLMEWKSPIVEANETDLARAEAENLAAPLLKRLCFDDSKIEQSAQGLTSVAELADPIGTVLARRELDSGLVLRKETCPIGVIAMIFESRPDALVQIASLALKSGNAIVLKGGSEAAESNRILTEVFVEAGRRAGIPDGWIQQIETRSDVGELLALDDLVDLMIPRGSNEFVRYIMDHTRIPVLGHADGVCHIYIDSAADAEIATAVTVDSKTQYVAVCNAVETLLVHADAAETILPVVAQALQDRGVEIRGCPRTVKAFPAALPATEEDWATEYLDMVISVRVVDSMAEAVKHINTYGSGHTDGIVTTDTETANAFIYGVDTASVMWNASTRFADGFRYGLGAEVGISTSKIHARGPVGVEGLLSYKWILQGRGHTVAPYSDGHRSFTHRELPAE
jgi:glutamate-5-semialdehyde dehydrogenase